MRDVHFKLKIPHHMQWKIIHDHNIPIRKGRRSPVDPLKWGYTEEQFKEFMKHAGVVDQGKYLVKKKYLVKREDIKV